MTEPSTRPATADATLAVLLRQAQWLLGDVAGNLQAGLVTNRKAHELADILEGLATVVRERVVPDVIDAPR